MFGPRRADWRANALRSSSGHLNSPDDHQEQGDTPGLLSADGCVAAQRHRVALRTADARRAERQPQPCETCVIALHQGGQSGVRIDAAVTTIAIAAAKVTTRHRFLLRYIKDSGLRDRTVPLV